MTEQKHRRDNSMAAEVGEIASTLIVLSAATADEMQADMIAFISRSLDRIAAELANREPAPA
jgi:hypothetical protein